jgi:hypothetical protein
MLPASMLGDYSTRVSPTPSCFLRRTVLLGNLFLIKSLLDLLFILYFLDHHTDHHYKIFSQMQHQKSVSKDQKTVAIILLRAGSLRRFWSARWLGGAAGPPRCRGMNRLRLVTLRMLLE